MRPAETACRFLLPPHRAGNCGSGAACRLWDAVSRQAGGGTGKRHAVTAGTHRRQKKEGGRNIAILDKWQCCDDTGRKHRNRRTDMAETDDVPSDDYEEYNRRTTDYGNGMIEIAAYHFPRLRYVGSGRTPSGSKTETSDQAQEARTHRQIYAIRRRIKGYAFSNSFRWFVTLTFNPEKINSLHYETVKAALLKWCRRMRDRYGQFDYLMIPKLHKSGAVHFHGLLGDVPACFVEAANPKTGAPVIRHNRQVYNLADWEYGFSDCEEIESPERAASYIAKYITAALLTDKTMYHKKRYFNSQGLAKPAVTYGMSDNAELDIFTPNFGVVETDGDGTNHFNIGIYNLKTDPETGLLAQTDTSYLIMAKNEQSKGPLRETVTMNTDTAATAGRKGEEHEHG